MKTVRVALDETLLERVDALVGTLGLSRSDFIREALRREVKRLENERLIREYAELGAAQREGLETYPPDNVDGLDLEDAVRDTNSLFATQKSASR